MFYIFSTIFHCYYNNYPYLCKKYGIYVNGESIYFNLF